jgi:rubrerythrin
MSKLEKYQIPCPQCKAVNEQTVFHSINDSIPDAANKIINGHINFATCPDCGNEFQIKTGLLYANHSQQFALYYHPNDFYQINEEIEGIKKMFGEDFFLTRPLKFTDWDEFIKELKDKEGIVDRLEPTYRVSSAQYARSYSGSYWTCDVCDGDSDTGCLASDPDVCPRG